MCPKGVPRLQFPHFCWRSVFPLEPTQKTQGANITRALHIFTCTFLFRTDKHGSQKLHRAAWLTTEFLHTLGATCSGEFQNPLETHCWIPLEGRTLLCKWICVRDAGIVLPVISLTSFFLAGVSSVMLVRRTTCSG